MRKDWRKGILVEYIDGSSIQAGGQVVKVKVLVLKDTSDEDTSFTGECVESNQNNAGFDSGFKLGHVSNKYSKSCFKTIEGLYEIY